MGKFGISIFIVHPQVSSYKVLFISEVSLLNVKYACRTSLLAAYYLLLVSLLRKVTYAKILPQNTAFAVSQNKQLSEVCSALSALKLFNHVWSKP